MLRTAVSIAPGAAVRRIRRKPVACVTHSVNNGLRIGIIAARTCVSPRRKAELSGCFGGSCGANHIVRPKSGKIGLPCNNSIKGGESVVFIVLISPYQFLPNTFLNEGF